MRKPLLFIRTTLCLILLVLGFPSTALAIENIDTTNQMVAYNESTGYDVYIDDWAQLLTSSEEDKLCDIMGPITAYGNVAFVSIDYNPYYSVEDYAQNYGDSLFGNESYTIFVIDMDYRKICIYSDGDIYKTITKAYANTITDNVYTYASDGEYYACAAHAFEQINTLLDGRTIAQPMKYISNALLAIALALLINYFIVMTVSRSTKASDSQLLNGIHTKVEITNPKTDFLHQTKRYSPQPKATPGVRSGGGGGRSGGGGSHSF